MSDPKKYTFGPVPSRRLGRSLGVDLVPLKTCTQNCIYCQLGVHGERVTQRMPYVDVAVVLKELKEQVDAGLNADYITLSGSGEPTLNSDIGRLIDGIRKVTDIPIAIITNGTLFTDDDVRRECSKADVVLPSLDAGDEKTFQLMNCPAAGIGFSAFVDGLCRFRSEFNGQIWLEVFFCEGVNTSDKQVSDMKAVIDFILPDRIQLNTAARPTVDPSAKKVSAEKLEAIAKQFGEIAEVVADYSKVGQAKRVDRGVDDVLEMLKRRPCSIDDICSGLAVEAGQVEPIIDSLTEQGKVIAEIRSEKTFYKTAQSSPKS